MRRLPSQAVLIGGSPACFEGFRNFGFRDTKVYGFRFRVVQPIVENHLQREMENTQTDVMKGFIRSILG